MIDIVDKLKKIKSNVEYQSDDTFLLNTKNKEADLDNLLYELDKYQTSNKFESKINQQKKILKKIKQKIKLEENNLKNIKSNPKKHLKKKIIQQKNSKINHNIDEQKIKSKFESNYTPKPYGSFKKKYKSLHKNKNSDSKNSDSKNSDSKNSDSKNSDSEESHTKESHTEESDTEESDTEESDTEESDTEDSDTEDLDTKNSDTDDSDIEESDTKHGDSEKSDSEKTDTKHGNSKKSDSKKTDLKQSKAKKNKEDKEDDYILDGLDKFLKRGGNLMENNNIEKTVFHNFDKIFKIGGNLNTNFLDEFKNPLLLLLNFIPILGGFYNINKSINYDILLFNNDKSYIYLLVYILHHIAYSTEIFTTLYLLMNYDRNNISCYVNILIVALIIRIMLGFIINYSIKSQENKNNPNNNIHSIKSYISKVNNLLITPETKLNQQQINKISEHLNFMLDYYKSTYNKYNIYNNLLYLFIIFLPILIFIYNYYNNKSIIQSLLITGIICILIIPTIRLYLLTSNNNNNQHLWNSGIIIEHVLILFIIYRVILIISDKYLKHADGLQLCDYIVNIWTNDIQK